MTRLQREVLKILRAHNGATAFFVHRMRGKDDRNCGNTKLILGRLEREGCVYEYKQPFDVFISRNAKPYKRLCSHWFVTLKGLTYADRPIDRPKKR